MDGAGDQLFPHSGFAVYEYDRIGGSHGLDLLQQLIRNAERLAERIVDNAKGGDIILLHDHRPEGAQAMLEALPGVIDKLRARGFEFVLAGSREEAECRKG